MTIDTKALRQLAEAANRPMSEIGLMEHKRAAMRAMHGALLPDDVLALLDALERKDRLLDSLRKAFELVRKDVLNPEELNALGKLRIEAITKEQK